ncbi:hypothetical protein [Sphingomonas sp. FARSPH]|jgi:hypothetical protein|nr:hypothetical protein [Sphingomonas sp. FARSPH]
MGNEDPWFIIALGVIALLVVAIAIFIPAKFIQIAIRDWRSRRKP